MCVWVCCVFVCGCVLICTGLAADSVVLKLLVAAYFSCACVCVFVLERVCFRCHACLFPGVCEHVSPCVAGCSLLGKSQLIMQFIVWLCWCGVQRAERGILTGSLAADQMTLMIFLSLFLFQWPTLLFAQSLRLIAHAGVSNFQLWNSGSVFHKRNHSPLPCKPTDRLPNYWSALL